ncbi:MAG: VOC family protein [Terriglobales bacterium]
MASYQDPQIRAVSPYLLVPDGERTLRFLKDVFDARELHVARDDKRLVHATLAIGDGTLMLGQPADPAGVQPSALYIYVPDVDATYRKALAAGARSLSEPEDMPYGDRGAGVKDDEGTTWWIGTHLGRPS